MAYSEQFNSYMLRFHSAIAKRIIQEKIRGKIASKAINNLAIKCMALQGINSESPVMILTDKLLFSS